MRWTIAAALLALAGCAGSKAEQRAEADTLVEQGVLAPAPAAGTWELKPEATVAFPLQVGAGTTVVKEGRQVGLDALQPGEPVRVTYALEPGSAKAVRIEVVPREVQPLGPAEQPGLDVLEPGTGPQPAP